MVYMGNIYIHDININKFDVTGISCNGCQYLTIENVIVGPQNNNIPTLGRYTHAKAILPRLKYLSDNYGENIITFWNRQQSVNELIDRLISQMDMVYNYVINGIEGGGDDENEEWIETQKNIFKFWWISNASASYDIVFAGGAAVSAIGTRIENEGNIIISNVSIHGLRQSVQEKYKVYGASTTVTMRGFFRDTFDWEAMTDNFNNMKILWWQL